MFDFINYLRQELNSDDVVVLPEQMFAKYGDLEPQTIYVVVKYLASSIEFGAETQPIQLLILSEQNGLEKAKTLFDSFTVTHNWISGIFDGTFVKQQYSSPVVLSNYNEISHGYRSVLYVSATLYLMENVADITEFKIKGISVKPFNTTWSYQMSGNTQAISGDLIASTVKNIATFSLSLSIPLLKTYISEDGFLEDRISGGSEQGSLGFGTYTIQVETKENYLLRATADGISAKIDNINQKTGEITYTKLNAGATTITYFYVCNNLLSFMLKVSAGQLSGNVNFEISFKVFDIEYNYTCKLISLQMTTTPNEIPTLQVGFQR